VFACRAMKRGKYKERYMKEIKELDVVEYIDDNGDKLKGTVVLVYTSIAGLRCVKINNFYLSRQIAEVKKI